MQGFTAASPLHLESGVPAGATNARYELELHLLGSVKRFILNRIPARFSFYVGDVSISQLDPERTTLITTARQASRKIERSRMEVAEDKTPLVASDAAI